MPKRLALRNIASLLGVSTMTVSRALREGGSAGKKLRDKN
jgi:DNA-binding LacI/PurR family transcriptional regulator